MIVDAEYEEIEGTGEELDFAEGDSLPWLESEEEDDGAGGVDRAQMIAFLALLAVIGVSVIGAVYLISNYNRGPVAVPDGSLIEAPEGPYKTRPDDAGGKQFAGTDDVAPGVGQGRDADGRMADDTGAGSGDQDLNVAMPAIGGSPTLASQTGARGGEAGTGGAGAGSSGNDAGSSGEAAQTASTGASNASGDVSGVGVQVGAYSSRARAEQGWRTLRGQSRALANAKRRILEGTIEGSPVFRLQAVAPTLSAAKTLCDALRKDGLDCQVKG